MSTYVASDQSCTDPSHPYLCEHWEQHIAPQAASLQSDVLPGGDQSNGTRSHPLLEPQTTVPQASPTQHAHTSTTPSDPTKDLFCSMPTELRIKVYNHLRIIPADPNNDTTMIVEYRWHPGHGWKIHPSRDVQLDLFRLGLTCPTLRTETLTIMPTYRLVISDPTAYSLAPASKVTFHTASRYPVTRLTVSISAEGALNNAVGRLLSSLAMGAQLAYFRLNIDVPKTSGIILHPASLLPNLHLMTINWHLVRSRAGVALHCRKYPAITTEWERFKHAEEDRRKDLRRRTTSAGKRALWAAERARLQKLRERESVVPDVRAAVFALRELSGDPDAGAELLVDVTERRKVVGEGGWLLL